MQKSRIGRRVMIIAMTVSLAAAPMAAGTPVYAAKKYTAKQFKRMGVIKYHGYKWTWYSQKVLPGKGLKIPGRHVDKNGFVVDKSGYIVLAHKNMKKGTVIKTPLGKKGKVYDRCPTSGVVDVYVNF